MERPFPARLLRSDLPRAGPFPVVEGSRLTRLDQNEAPLDLPEELKRQVLERAAGAPWNRYPSRERYREAKAQLAAAVGQPPERVLLTAGCDQLILTLLWAAGGPGRRVRIFEPTYPGYRFFAAITATELDAVVVGADYDVAAPRQDQAAELVILARPNNPTGGSPEREVVRRWAESGSLLLVDEAYAAYAGESILDLVPEHPNLIVGRSLSKSALAGLRLGYGVGHPALVETLERLLLAPDHLGPLQLAAAASQELSNSYEERLVRATVAERERLQLHLEEMGVRYWPSRANFVLFEVEDAAAVHAGLLEQGIVVRDVSDAPGLGRHLRVTVGTPEENDRFCRALGLIL